MAGTTPNYNIPFPDSTTPAYTLPAEFQRMAIGFDTALAVAALKPVSNTQITTAASAVARDTYWGKPATESARLALQAKGPLTVRTDTGIIERYFATYNATTNPQGKTPAGWYNITDGASQAPTILANTALTLGSGITLGAFCEISKDSSGLVSVNMHLESATAMSAGQTVCTLPAGWRPKGTSGYGGLALGGGLGGNVGVRIAATGVVSVYAAPDWARAMLINGTWRVA